MTMRLVALFATTLALGAAGVALMVDQTAPAPRPRRVAARLLGPAGEIAGVDVPGDLTGRNEVYLRVSEPADVTVTLPDGRKVRLLVKYVSLNVDRGVVVDVHLLPLMHSVPYKEAVAALRRCLEDLGVVPDARMRAMMAAWPDDAPGFDPVNQPGSYPRKCHASTSTPVAEKTYLWAEVRPADDGGWFVAITLAADEDSRRALWDPTFRARAAPPSGGPAGKQ